MVQIKLKAANIDVLVRLNDPFSEEADFWYWIEVATPKNLSHLLRN